MQIGRKIYYGKSNGIVIWDKGEMEGAVVETTLEQDKETMPVLNMIPVGELGVKQLDFGELRDEFASSNGYIINPLTQEVEFASV